MASDAIADQYEAELGVKDDNEDEEYDEVDDTIYLKAELNVTDGIERKADLTEPTPELPPRILPDFDAVDPADATTDRQQMRRSGGGRARRYWEDENAANLSTCYNCGQKGHMSYQCTEPASGRNAAGNRDKDCFLCGQKGHVRADCPTQQQQRSSSMGGASDVECYQCGRRGHMRAECPDSQPKMECWTCGGNHLARECHQQMRRDREPVRAASTGDDRDWRRREREEDPRRYSGGREERADPREADYRDRDRERDAYRYQHAPMPPPVRRPPPPPVVSPHQPMPPQRYSTNVPPPSHHQPLPPPNPQARRRTEPAQYERHHHQMPPPPPPRIFCYNCGGEGHDGSQCRELRYHQLDREYRRVEHDEQFHHRGRRW